MILSHKIIDNNRPNITLINKRGQIIDISLSNTNIIQRIYTKKLVTTSKSTTGLILKQLCITFKTLYLNLLFYRQLQKWVIIINTMTYCKKVTQQ